MPSRKLVIGPLDAPLLTFDNNSIISITEDKSVSMVGAELPIDQFVPIVSYDLIIKYKIVPADRGTYNGIVSADGKLLVSKYNYDIRAIPYGTEIRLYTDSRIDGLYYVSEVNRVARDSFRIKCVSAVGLMDKQRHVGDVYTGARFDAVLAEILGDEYEYIVESDVAELQVFGRLPYATRRANLHQLLIAYGVNLTKSDTGGMLFTFLNATDFESIPSNRIYSDGQVIYGDVASRVEVLEHGYYYLPSTPAEVLFDTKGENTVNTVVTFKNPIYAESLTVDNEGTLQILEYGTNYAIVSGSGVLSGTPYVHTTKLITATNEAAVTEKIISVENATLITMANSENCLKRISEYYFNANRVKNSIVLDAERPGRRYVFENPFNEHTSGFLASLSATGSSTTKAECEFVVDYIPVAQGQAFGKREILELSEEEQIWTVPDSVYEKDVPQVRVVLIGAGYNGEDGENGEDGGVPEEQQVGLGGKGGAGGKGAPGGKILSVTIDCSNLAFLRYGKSDKNTWLFAGDDYYNSGNGNSSPSGFVELFTGAVFALPGNSGIDGAPGGKGGSYPPIAAVGTTSKPEPGGNVEFNGVTYKGGKAANKAIIKGGDVKAWLHENMHLYFGGPGGGGAAAGKNGGNAVGAFVDNGVDMWEYGGNGADAPATNPTRELYGSGGNGGNGGGGGGGLGTVHWWNHVYSTLIVMNADPENLDPGKGGKGGLGTQGWRGCIVMYY